MIRAPEAIAKLRAAADNCDAHVCSSILLPKVSRNRHLLSVVTGPVPAPRYFFEPVASGFNTPKMYWSLFAYFFAASRT